MFKKIVSKVMGGVVGFFQGLLFGPMITSASHIYDIWASPNIMFLAKPIATIFEIGLVMPCRYIGVLGYAVHGAIQGVNLGFKKSFFGVAKYFWDEDREKSKPAKIIVDDNSQEIIKLKHVTELLDQARRDPKPNFFNSLPLEICHLIAAYTSNASVKGAYDFVCRYTDYLQNNGVKVYSIKKPFEIVSEFESIFFRKKRKIQVNEKTPLLQDSKKNEDNAEKTATVSLR